jgi:hypothetical protein
VKEEKEDIFDKFEVMSDAEEMYILKYLHKLLVILCFELEFNIYSIFITILSSGLTKSFK